MPTFGDGFGPLLRQTEGVATQTAAVAVSDVSVTTYLIRAFTRYWGTKGSFRPVTPGVTRFCAL